MVYSIRMQDLETGEPVWNINSTLNWSPSPLDHHFSIIKLRVKMNLVNC